MRPNYQSVEDAFRECRINGASSQELNAYLIALANQPIDNDRVRHRDIIRGLTLNHILLQRHMDRLDKQNAVIQWLVIFLTAMSLAIGGIQIWYADRADKRESAGSAPAQAQPAEPARPESSPAR